MSEPVFCTLDNLSYEQAAIHAYITVHRQTLGDMKLADDIKADTVLVPNKTLRKAIEEYQKLEQNILPLSIMRP